MSRSLFTVVLSAGALVIGGAAFAQSGGTGGTGTMETSPSASGAMKESAAPSRDLIGKDVENAQGEKIGEVKDIEGNSLIVGVGGFLGIGERDVAIPYSQVSRSGTGDSEKLQVSMTKEQLEALPETKAPARSGGSTSDTGSSGARTGTDSMDSGGNGSDSGGSGSGGGSN